MIMNNIEFKNKVNGLINIYKLKNINKDIEFNNVIAMCFCINFEYKIVINNVIFYMNLKDNIIENLLVKKESSTNYCFDNIYRYISIFSNNLIFLQLMIIFI